MRFQGTLEALFETFTAWPRRWAASLRWALAALPLLLLTGACGGGSETSAGDTALQEISQSTGRLEGNWLLLEFRPQSELEPMLAALLAAQIGQLRVTFRSGTMTIEGIGVTAQRSYRVTQAAADGFALDLTDPDGGTYHVTGAFQGTDLSFVSKSDPWRGTGRLRRQR